MKRLISLELYHVFHNFFACVFFSREGERQRRETKKSRLSLSIADWYSTRCTVADRQVVKMTWGEISLCLTNDKNHSSKIIIDDVSVRGEKDIDRGKEYLFLSLSSANCESCWSVWRLSRRFGQSRSSSSKNRLSSSTDRSVRIELKWQEKRYKTFFFFLSSRNRMMDMTRISRSVNSSLVSKRVACVILLDTPPISTTKTESKWMTMMM